MSKTAFQARIANLTENDESDDAMDAAILAVDSINGTPIGKLYGQIPRQIAARIVGRGFATMNDDKTRVELTHKGVKRALVKLKAASYMARGLSSADAHTRAADGLESVQEEQQAPSHEQILAALTDKDPSVNFAMTQRLIDAGGSYLALGREWSRLAYASRSEVRAVIAKHLGVQSAPSPKSKARGGNRPDPYYGWSEGVDTSYRIKVGSIVKYTDDHARFFDRPKEDVESTAKVISLKRNGLGEVIWSHEPDETDSVNIKWFRLATDAERAAKPQAKKDKTALTKDYDMPLSDEDVTRLSQTEQDDFRQKHKLKAKHRALVERVSTALDYDIDAVLGFIIAILEDVNAHDYARATDKLFTKLDKTQDTPDAEETMGA